MDKTTDELEKTLKRDRNKSIALSVLIGITLLFYIFKFFIMPIIFGKPPDEFLNLKSVLKRHFSHIYKSYSNIFMLLLFFALVIVYFTFDNNNFRHMGIILIVAYITSLAVEAKLFITGALLNAVIIYIYIMILIRIDKNQKEKLREKIEEKDKKSK